MSGNAEVQGVRGITTPDRVARSVSITNVPGTGELTLFTFPARRNCAVFVTGGSSSVFPGALVRIYASIADGRVVAEVGRGRCPQLPAPLAGSAICARTRDPVSCDEFVVTVQTDNVAGLTPNGQAVTFAAESWNTGDASGELVTDGCALYNAKPNGADLVSLVSSDLWDVVAYNPNASDRWLYFYDPNVADPLTGGLPWIPPLLVPANGTNASIGAVKVPYRFPLGMKFRLSSSAASFVASADPIHVRAMYQ